MPSPRAFSFQQLYPSMNIKISALTFCLAIICFTAMAAAPKILKSNRISGYTLIDGKQPSRGYLGLLFVRDRQFNMYFKKDASSKTPAPAIDFEKYTLITLMGAKTKTESILSIEKVTRIGNRMEVFFVTKPGKKTGKDLLPFCLYTIDKQQNVYELAYYVDGKLLEEVKN